MNKRIGIVLVLAGLLFAAIIVAIITGYKVSPNGSPPDTVGEDKGTP